MKFSCTEKNEQWFNYSSFAWKTRDTVWKLHKDYRAYQQKTLWENFTQRFFTVCGISDVLTAGGPYIVLLSLRNCRKAAGEIQGVVQHLLHIQQSRPVKQVSMIYQ